MLMRRRQYHVLAVVVFGARGRESGGPSEMANNPEVSLVGLPDRILFWWEDPWVLLHWTPITLGHVSSLNKTCIQYILLYWCSQQQRGALLHLPSISIWVLNLNSDLSWKPVASDGSAPDPFSEYNAWPVPLIDQTAATYRLELMLLCVTSTYKLHGLSMRVAHILLLDVKHRKNKVTFKAVFSGSHWLG